MPASRSTQPPAGIRGDLAEYLGELTARLQAQLGDRLVSAWVIGSGALGDFDRLRSDVDVQAVSEGRVDRSRLRQLAAVLSHDALPCPVRGLEFVLYAREDLADPDGPAFQLNLNTGPGMTQHEGFDPTREPRFWFTLDVAIARQRARSLSGPAPSAIVPELPRPLVLGALGDALDWYRANDEVQSVFAACRVGLGDRRPLAVQGRGSRVGERAPSGRHAGRLGASAARGSAVARAAAASGSRLPRLRPVGAARVRQLISSTLPARTRSGR
jgi:hypothetical protein